jgi:hypothetical protein
MRFFFIILLFPIIIYSQERSGNPNVELPEFVITGQELMNLQQTKKPEPELVSVVSEEFLKPPLSPETPDLDEVGGPVDYSLNLRDSVYYYNGNVTTMLGIYSLPSVGVNVSAPYSNGLFQGRLNGQNIRPYISNAERYFLDAGVSMTLFSGYESSFLPGTQYRLSGDFDSRSYKLFAGNQPNLKRNFYQGAFGASVKNIYYDKFLMGASTGYKSSILKDEEFRENLFNVGGFLRLNLENFNAGGYIDYKNQAFRDSLTSNKIYDFISIRPYAGFEFSRFLKTAFGFNYSRSRGSDFFVPYASIGFRFSKEFTIFGEYSPGGEFLTASDFLDQNLYFNPKGNPNIYLKESHDLQGTLKYEYSRYFELNGGVRIRSYKNLPFYSEMMSDGTFLLNTTEAETYSLIMNLLFHKGPFGYFFASAEAGETKDNENNFVPYFPSLISSLTYGYDFPIGLNAETNLIYRSGSYADTANTEKLNSYINLNLNFSYNISENLKLRVAFNNLLDKRNYLWNNYRETPLDFSAGVSYKW